MLVLASLLLLSSVVGIQGLPRKSSGDKAPPYLELAEKIAEEFMKRQGEGGNDVGMYIPPNSKTCVKLSLKKDKTKILMTNGSLMNVESIAECPLSVFFNTFDVHYTLSDDRFWNPIFGLFESVRALLYLTYVGFFL